ncbi:MAG: hypothetical protein GYA51_00780, partial [Candidatus Methanofastidiosa archaeon]|nr:hypothetical protein [Candidatus Methanofastidiosa archaeon]
MMWKNEHGPRHGPMDHGCGCGCHDGRHFFTKEERLEKLEDYKNWLEKEKQG